MPGNERYNLSSVDVGGGQGSHASSVPQHGDTVDEPCDFVQSATDVDDPDLLALELADEIEKRADSPWLIPKLSKCDSDGRIPELARV